MDVVELRQRNSAQEGGQLKCRCSVFKEQILLQKKKKFKNPIFADIVEIGSGGHILAQ